MSHHDFRGHLRRGARKVWTTLLGERSLVQRYGSLRDRERWGLVRRPNYAYGILRAADVATFFGQSAVTVCEFGVASGGGLLNMIEIADLVSRDTGVTVRVVGFDNGEGLPEPQGYKDHPEIWSGGDFRIEDRDGLLRRTEGKAEIIFGDVAETVRPFAAGLDPSAPLGFIAIDVDIYSAARSALWCLLERPEVYSPAISMYVDDIGFFFANEWCGELAAIREFNAEHELRKIDVDRSLPGRRPMVHERWYRNMYVCHVLDHPARSAPRDRRPLGLRSHDELMQRFFLY